MSINDELLFSPYYRLGFSENSTYYLGIMKNLSNGGTLHKDQIEKAYALRGPESVISILPKMIVRRYPTNNQIEVETNYFPYIVFKDPDFPWRYSVMGKRSVDEDYDLTRNTPETIGIVESGPARTAPWICLIVLSEEELNDGPQILSVNGHSLLEINSSLLPQYSSLWATAHVQVKEYEDAESISDYIEEKPENCMSRLMSLRELDEKTKYFVFLVPTRAAALIPHYPGSYDPATLDQDEPMWRDDHDSVVQLPIYDMWEFNTSEKKVDFESLLLRIEPRTVDPRRVGILPVNISYITKDAGNQDVFNDRYFKREGALAAPGFSDERLGFTEVFGEFDENDSPILDGQGNQDWTNTFHEQKKLYDVLCETLKTTNFNEFNPQLYLPSFLHNEPDPLVSYPAYGKYYYKSLGLLYPQFIADEDRKRDQWLSNAPWQNEVNLDIRNRWGSGLGTTVIQSNQDEYSRRCWEQVGDVRQANEKIRKTKASLQIQKSLFTKHFSKLNESQSILISSSYHKNIPSEVCGKATTFQNGLKASKYPNGIFNHQFKRLLVGKFVFNAPEFEILNTLPPDSELIEPPEEVDIGDVGPVTPPVTGPGGVSSSSVSSTGEVGLGDLTLGEIGVAEDTADDTSSAESTDPESGIQSEISSALKSIKDELKIEVVEHSNIPQKKKERVPFCPNLDSNAAKNFLTYSNFENRALSRLNRYIGKDDAVDSNVDQIVIGPVIDDPMYAKLRDKSADYIIPGLDKIPPNSAVLMEENRRFIESYMLGLNHEMVRELVWREFPTTRNITVFSHFWESATTEPDEDDPDNEEKLPTDIDPIITWTHDLGGNKTENSATNAMRDQGSLLVFVIKADLVKRYPSLIVYAIKSREPLTASSDLNDFPGCFVNPIFKADIADDVVGLGFPFTMDSILNDTQYHYYFVIQENYTLLKFGLDLETGESPSVAQSPNDLHWGLLNDTDHFKQKYINSLGLTNYIFMKDIQNSSPILSSSIANNTLQVPNLALYKAEDMLDLS